MADLWYYSRDAIRRGPFSDRQLQDLAVQGHMVPSDTVSRAGVERGMRAVKVKTLFRPAAPAAVDVAVAPPRDEASAPDKALSAVTPMSQAAAHGGEQSPPIAAERADAS